MSKSRHWEAGLTLGVYGDGGDGVAVGLELLDELLLGQVVDADVALVLKSAFPSWPAQSEQLDTATKRWGWVGWKRTARTGPLLLLNGAWLLQRDMVWAGPLDEKVPIGTSWWRAGG